MQRLSQLREHLVAERLRGWIYMSQDSFTDTYVPSESFRCGSLDGCWWTGGCSQPARGGCGGDGSQDVRQHVVVALR